MLRQLRSEKFMKRLLWIILGFTIPSFVVFYGWQSKVGQGQESYGPAATLKFGWMKKKEVSQPDLVRAKNVLQGRLERYAQESGMRVDRTAVEHLADSPSIVREAVSQALLEKFAEDQGIRISDREVEKMLQQIPAQQKMMLLQYLQERGMSADEFARQRQYDMLLGRVRQILAARTRVTYHQAWQEYLQKNEKLTLDFVRLNVPEYATKVTVDESELASYFKQNAEKFRVPDQVRYAYILVSKDDLKSSVTVTDDEITSYYEQHREDFRLPPSAHVRQIFLAKPQTRDVDTTAVEEQTSQTAAKAMDIYQRIVKGDDFATLAGQFNEEKVFPPREDVGTTASDAATTAGGNLGFVLESTAKGFYGDDWTSTVFHMEPGSVHKPIETRRGFHVLKLEAKKEGVVQPLARVRELIKSRIADEKAGPLFDKMGEELRANAKKYTSLEKLAEVTSQTVSETPKVDRRAKFVPGIGRLGEFEEVVQDIQRGVPSDVLSDPSKHLVIMLKEEFPAHDPSLEEVRAKVVDAYRTDKAREKARQDAQDLKSRSTNLASMETAVRDKGLTVTRSRPFVRAEAPMVLGQIEDFAKISQQAKKGDVLLSAVGSEKEPQAFVVWHVADVTPPSRTEFAKELPRVLNELADQKAQVLVEEYLRDRWNELSKGQALSINPAFQEK